MPELRQNIVTKEWVIIATERAKRPEEFSKKEEGKKVPEFEEDCPFCPGNEDKTPAHTYIIEEEGKWKIRVIPNKFAALQKEGTRNRHFEGIYRNMTGVGIHEVIIESPKHNQFFPLLSEKDVENLVITYIARYNEIAKDDRIEQIIIFKNHGKSAGTSLIHPHSQLVALPIVPFSIRSRAEEAMRYFDDNGKCVFCKMIEEETEAKERIVFENEKFITFVPYAAYSPFHIWLLPKRHIPSFGDTSVEECKGLAECLRTTIVKVHNGLGNPSFNYMIRSCPLDDKGSDYLHWHISIVPRITKTAGFELGSGMFINVGLPEESAEFLRNIEF